MNHIILSAHFKMEIAKTQPFDKPSWQKNYTLPVAKGHEVNYPFQWLLFKPQLHAVEPFVTNQTTRNENTKRLSK
jgi:hypothetical protein